MVCCSTPWGSPAPRGTQWRGSDLTGGGDVGGGPGSTPSTSDEARCRDGLRNDDRDSNRDGSKERDGDWGEGGAGEVVELPESNGDPDGDDRGARGGSG